MEWSEAQTNEFYSVVGNKIKEIRTRAKVTQTDLAKALGLTRSSVANIEAGRQRLQLHGLVQAATVLRVPIDHLVYTPDFDQNSLVAIADIDKQPATTADFLSAVVRRAGSA
ncbi:helix-turn-helix transcriptional regulator [Amycolatopsis sp. WQ 127309]|uniref:helix-turn-helix transcriptional regulator n=1 Tax=Amycolatopsis sp. WQ 127309 TaxID=2932773 RepID=UPI001FF3793E|nr:helix-turn-helix transcriptional regulator [Amycolatopsis sp. WQ 127309]UOZ10201.1 helix-turn-helix domain-containing protein [Amycolatopsis sp. WQ 127309]